MNKNHKAFLCGLGEGLLIIVSIAGAMVSVPVAIMLVIALFFYLLTILTQIAIGDMDHAISVFDECLANCVEDGYSQEDMDLIKARLEEMSPYLRNKKST